MSVLSGRLLSLIPFEDVSRDFVVLEDLPRQKGYVCPPIGDQTFAPEVHEKWVTPQKQQRYWQHIIAEMQSPPLKADPRC